ncbi:MAG: CHAD domain-containing protein [Alphaproteobacteria bacterium]|nr:CHAD domain-containing protein [Alphaproteobacteria bacterium]
MAHEIELKLQVPRDAISKAADLPGLRQLIQGPPRRQKLTSVYFDTPSLKLRDHGLALRVRRIGKKRVQTIKAISKGGRGALGRDEWEEEIASAIPDLSLAKGTALAPLVTRKLRHELHPTFETVVERTTLPIRAGGSAVELAVDRGYINAGRRRELISELELELKEGDPADLVEIAERLRHSLPVAYGAQPKQDRGYALVTGEADCAVRAAEIAIDTDFSAAEAFRVIALACLDHALANERAVRGGNPEGIHQMRVGLRRLRAALTLFKPLIDSPQTDAVKTELKWLTEQLGQARDFDVLLTEGIGPLRQDSPAAETDTLIQDLQTRRGEAVDRARAAVNSGRYQKLGLMTALWILDGQWRRSGDEAIAAARERPAVGFAVEILGRRLKKILKKANRIEDLDPSRRHKLRIGVKKLRYATQFFAGLFSDGKSEAARGRFAKPLKRLQTNLGRLNDIYVHKRVASGIAHGGGSPKKRADKSLAIGFVLGHEQTEMGRSVEAAAKSARQLARATPFWE